MTRILSPWRGVDDHAAVGVLAELADTATGPVIDVRSLWYGLVAGEIRITESFFSLERFYFVFSPTAPLRHRPPQRHFRLLEDVLTGSSQKAAAIDGRVAFSTVASACKGCLAYMGLTTLPSKISPLLNLLALRARNRELTVDPRVRQIEHADGQFSILSAPRCDAPLACRLSPAKYEVTRLLVEGKTHAEISAARGTSPRTIANQLASAFADLGVSSRAGLVNRLLVKMP